MLTKIIPNLDQGIQIVSFIKEIESEVIWILKY